MKSGNPEYQILVVDDDVLVQKLISHYLSEEGYQVQTAGSGQEMFERLHRENEIGLILLDLGLPDEDGIVLARKLRARSTIPIIILTARERVEDRLAGLDVGADDYLTKNVDPTELLLRVRNLIRRSRGFRIGPAAPVGTPDHVFRFGDWMIDLEGYTLTSPKGQDVIMTKGEFHVLGALLNKRGRTLSRDQLLDAITGHEEAPSDRMIDAFISRIRKKIENNPKNPEYIQTITGVGYKFTLEH